MTAVLAIGAEQVAVTALSILADFATGVGAFVLLRRTLAITGKYLGARAERKADERDDATMAMLDRWEDEPGIIPDPLAGELDRLLDRGEGHG